MNNRPLKYSIVVLLIAALLITLYYLSENRQNSYGVTTTNKTPTPKSNEQAQTSVKTQKKIVETPQTSANTQKLNIEGGTLEGDISHIAELLRQQRMFHGGSNPVGFNDEITAAMLGKNAKGLAILRNRSDVINSQGELIDRYGTPYRFHAVSGKEMHITSAGPDRKHHTEDDVSSQ